MPNESERPMAVRVDPVQNFTARGGQGKRGKWRKEYGK